jgi:hypothetical protein
MIMAQLGPPAISQTRADFCGGQRTLFGNESAAAALIRESSN